MKKKVFYLQWMTNIIPISKYAYNYKTLLKVFIALTKIYTHMYKRQAN